MEKLTNTFSQSKPLKDVVDKVNEVVDMLESDAVASNMQNITYAELKTLRDEGKLIKGTFYRITDYECSTSLSGTTSAGHIFDIIVRADSTNVLNEEAWAAAHDYMDDTTTSDTEKAYFSQSNLSAWKLRYCIDNDTDRFAWADTSNGKGVIYYMKDEWGNEVPYDFKNIQFLRYFDEDADTWHGFYSASSERRFIPLYTFSTDVRAYSSCTGTPDYSVVSYSNYHYAVHNIIKPNYGVYYEGNPMLTQVLNNICLCGQSEDNVFETNCFEMTFDNNCINNHFDAHCYRIHGGYCFKDCIVRGCCNWLNIGNSCYNCTYGYLCSRLTIGDTNFDCKYGYNCYDITTSDDCYRMTYGTQCHDIDLSTAYIHDSEIKSSTCYIETNSDLDYQYHKDTYMYDYFHYVTVYPSVSGTKNANNVLNLTSADFNNTKPIILV